MSEYLVGSPAFKAGGTGDPRTAGSIPVHLRHLLSITLVALVGFVLTAPPASAQARLLSSNPVDGESLQTLETFQFEFDTLLLADEATVTVTKRDGTPFPVSETTVDGTLLQATMAAGVPSGNYEIGYSVRSADGSLSEGSIRVSVDAPEQALAGGLLVILGIALAMALYVAFVFRADKMRRVRRPASPR